MALAKTLVALGNWLEKHFPEKVTAGEVRTQIAAIEVAVADIAAREQLGADALRSFSGRLAALEAKAEMFNSDMTKTKIMLLAQRQSAGR